MLTPNEVLANAADYIEQHGWIQHNAEDSRGQVCALGAIGRAAYAPGVPENERWDLYDEASDVMVDHLGRQIIEWNDTPGQTAEEVVRAMREAAHVESR